jgi:hypothetical protein
MDSTPENETMQAPSYPVFDPVSQYVMTAPHFKQMNHSDPKCLLMNDYEGNHTGSRAFEALTIIYEWEASKKPQQ